MHTHTHTHTHIYIYMLRSKKENARWMKKLPQCVVALKKQLKREIACCGCFKQSQRAVACEDMPWCEDRVVAVKGNDHNEFGIGSCGNCSENSEGFGLTCDLCVRKNWINIQREGAKSGQEQKAKKKMVSLSNSGLPTVKIGTNVVVRVPDFDRGRLAPQKYPSSRRWCQLFLLGFICWQERRSTWAAVCWQWIHNCWQQPHRGTWRALQFTISSVSLNENVWK